MKIIKLGGVNYMREIEDLVLLKGMSFRDAKESYMRSLQRIHGRDVVLKIIEYKRKIND